MKILNDCRHSPPGLVWQLRRSLSWIDQADLEGLYCVQLFDEMPDIDDETPESVKQAIANDRLIPGQYIPKKEKTSAYIMLFINVIYRAIPAIYYWTPVPTLRLASNLAHGVAYHLLVMRGHLFKPEEESWEKQEADEFANQYVAGVLKKMEARWYYRLGQWGIKDLAETYYILGMQDWKSKDYKKAADHWSKAWVLNPSNKDAIYWYGRAKEICGPNQNGQGI